VNSDPGLTHEAGVLLWMVTLGNARRDVNMKAWLAFERSKACEGMLSYCYSDETGFVFQGMAESKIALDLVSIFVPSMRKHINSLKAQLFQCQR
jgi:hypothetical protein